MTPRTWLYLGVACALVVMAVLAPLFGGDVEDFSAFGPPRTFASVEFDSPSGWSTSAERARSATRASADALRLSADRVRDRTPPAAPIIIEPHEGRVFDFPRLVQQSAFDPVAHVPAFFFSGTAEPGSTVSLTQGALQQPLGGARADARGRWEVRTFSYGTLLPLRGAIEVGCGSSAAA
jgi:hypothetical protein